MLRIACVIAFAYGPGVMAANCAFTYSDKYNTTVTLNFGASVGADSLTIPQDAPIGTVIFEQSLHGAELRFTCRTATLYGFAMNPTLGNPSGTTYPLGKTGLSFRIGSPNPNIPLMPPPFNLSAGNYTANGGSYTLTIFKSGELSSTNEIAAGFLGNIQVSDLVFIKFNLLNPIHLNTASCQTPSVPVAMGDDYRLDEFSKSGDTPRKIKFNIALNQCQRGIKKVTYQLKATTQVIGSKKGIVALNANSTAKGIGLQLMNDVGQPIALDTVYPFNGFNTTGTDFKAPLVCGLLPLGRRQSRSRHREHCCDVHHELPVAN